MADRWFLAPSLAALRDQANSLWPNRDRASDGSIGDSSHSARSSDHNPDWAAPGTRRGIVRAYDLDEDLDGNGTDRGAELAWWVQHLASTRDPRVAYVIYEGRIMSSTIAPWTWRPYSGVNAHRKHVHVSILHTVAAEQNTSPWFPEEDMPLNTADLEKIRNELRAVLNEGTGKGQEDWAGTSAADLDVGQKTFNEARAARSGVAVLLARTPDVDEAQLAAELAPLIVANPRSISDTDLDAIATAVADEQHRRSAG
jgi:hypothetical protein